MGAVTTFRACLVAAVVLGAALLGDAQSRIVRGGSFAALNADEIFLDITNRDVLLSRGAANRLDLATGDHFSLVDARVTAGSGTGVTVDQVGTVRRQVYKVSVIQSHWIANDVTQDLTIATLPAKTRITDVIADVTQVFACTAVCTTATLSMVVGKGAGGSEYLDSFDVDAALAVVGDLDSERGASLDGIINGEIPSWASTQTVVARLTSGTGNLGDDATTNLSGGDITFYLTTERLP